MSASVRPYAAAEETIASSAKQNHEFLQNIHVENPDLFSCLFMSLHGSV